MQNRFTADIGDYVKLGILRALSPGYRLGVIWWLFPDEDHNKDGRHIGYLDHADRWRHYDPELFDSLRQIVTSNQRHVQALEVANILPGAIFASDMIPTGGTVQHRQKARQKWFEIVAQKVQEADLLFVDPDNGLEPEGFTHGSSKAGKSVTLAEVRALARPGRCLIVYHHHTRRAGGHHAEMDYWAGRLRTIGFERVDALRAKPYSPRVFFLLDAPDDFRQRAEMVAERWNGMIDWHPDKQMTGGRPLMASSGQELAPVPLNDLSERDSTPDKPETDLTVPSRRFHRRRSKGTTEIRYILFGNEFDHSRHRLHAPINCIGRTNTAMLHCE
jgi:hypothetical protein